MKQRKTEISIPIPSKEKRKVSFLFQTKNKSSIGVDKINLISVTKHTKKPRFRPTSKKKGKWYHALLKKRKKNVPW